jgi:adenosylhomocysteine nucleosidase
MMLRWLISEYAGQFLRQKLRDRVSEKLQPEPPQEEQEESAEPEEPLPPPEVLLLFALPVESQGVVDRLERAKKTRFGKLREHTGLWKQRPVLVAETGMGMTAARRSAESLLDCYRPAWVVSAGFAGGLQDGIARGDLVMADRVAAAGGGEWSIGLKLSEEAVRATPGLRTGRVLTVDRLIRSPEEKRRLGSEHQAIACDMETAAIAQVCRERKVRFLSVRLISDAVDDTLPPDVEWLVQQKTAAGKLGAATGALFRRPGAAKDFWRLYEEAAGSSKRLASFLGGVLPQLQA